MNWVTILTLVVTSAYLVKIGVIKSISDSYRTTSDTRVYHAFFILSAVLIACQGVYSERLEIPYVIAGFAFYGISLAAKFWGDKLEGILHGGFTYLAILIGLSLTIVRIWPFWGYWSLGLVVLMGIGAMTVQKFVKSNKTYWQEVCAYVVIFGPIVPNF